MLYSVQFFALKGEKFAATLRKPPAKLQDKLKRYVERELKSDKEAIPPILAAAKSIFKGEIPKRSPQEFFDAFFAILNVSTERICPDNLTDFKSDYMLYDAGFWPWFHEEKPPFSFPLKKEPPPEFGYMSNTLMREVVLPGVRKLPPCTDGRIARNQFAEIAESVADDGLDLVGYYTIW